MSSNDEYSAAGAEFGNNRATQQLLKVLTDGFTRMAAVAERATTPQAALHEAVATANAAFDALPLPPKNSALSAAALSAHRAHLDLLRTLADFNPQQAESRAAYDRRVRKAVNHSNKLREELVFAVDETKRNNTSATSSSNFHSTQNKSRELVDLVTLVYGDASGTSWVRGDILAAASAHNSLESLFDRVNEHYASKAQAINDTLARQQQQRGASTTTTIVVQPLVEPGAAGQHVIVDKLSKYVADETREKFQREVLALLAPERSRQPDNAINSVPLAIAAARLRAHPEFATTRSTVRMLPGVDQDIAEFEADFHANASLFRRLLKAFFDTVHQAISLPSVLRLGEREARRREKRLVLENRLNELRERLSALDALDSQEARNARLGRRELGEFTLRVRLIREYLSADTARGESEMYWARPHVQLRSLILARDRELVLKAKYDRSGETRDEDFVKEYTKQIADEKDRLVARLGLENAVLTGERLTPAQMQEAIKAEVEDRIFESYAGVKARLETLAPLKDVVFELSADGLSARLPAPPAPQAALPADDRRASDQAELARVSQRVAAKAIIAEPATDIFEDPAFDDVVAWRLGFRGTLAPEIVELYFGSKLRVSDDERIARLPLLRAYVRSVGTINRSSLRGFSTPIESSAFAEAPPTFEDLVERQLNRQQTLLGENTETLSSLLIRLQLYSVDENQTLADELLTDANPRVLAKIPAAGTPNNDRLRSAALRAIDEILKTMRVETLSTLYRIGDTLSLLEYGRPNITDASSTTALRDTRVRVAPSTDLTNEQRERMLHSIEESGRVILGSVQRDVTNRQLTANAELAALDRTSVAVDTSMRQFTHLDYATARRAIRGGAVSGAEPLKEKAADAAQLVFVGHRLPARFFDESLGDLVADIQFRANTSDLSAANQEALERIFDSADCRIMRTFTRYELGNTLTGESQLYVDDVYRYTVAREAQRLQIVDVFDSSSVTLTLRDPRTDTVTARVLDRVVFGAPATALTDAQTLLNNIHSESTAAAAGQPLLALVAALFVRARLTDTRPTPASYIGIDDEVSMLERLLALPRRGYAAFKSLYDIALAFAHESNFSSQALLALAIAFANVNYLVLLFGVAQALWPAFVCVLRSIGFVDALARLMFQALFTATRKIGVGMSWTLVARLLGVFERMSWRHPRAGARRRELQLLRYYMAQMSADGASLTPLDIIPSADTTRREAFIDRLYAFVIEFGSPARTGLARRTFDTMVGAMFAPLRSLLAKIPQSLAGVVSTLAWVVSGESVDGSPFSVIALGALNVFATTLFVYTLPACNNQWLAFFKVFVTNIITRATWRKTFDIIIRKLPSGDNRVLRGTRFTLKALSIIGPDLTSYLSGREFVVTDSIGQAAYAGYEQLRRFVTEVTGRRLGFGGGDDADVDELPHVVDDRASTSSSVLRFIDRPQQAVDSYVAFAGRFAGRTFWSILRAYWEARRLDALSRSAAQAVRRTSSTEAMSEALDSSRDADDELSQYIDELDLRESLDNFKSKAELQRAFFRRPSENDLWYELLASMLVYSEQNLSINLNSAYFGPANEANRFTPLRRESFIVARNFILLSAYLRDQLFAPVTFARARFILEFVAGDKQTAVRGLERALGAAQASIVVPEAGLLSSAAGEAMEFYDSDTEEHVEQTDKGWRAWRTFTIDSARFREFGVLIDRIERQIAGVRLVQVLLHTGNDLGDDGAFVFLDGLFLQHFADETNARDFSALLVDVDVDRFGEESLGFGEGPLPQE